MLEIKSSVLIRGSVVAFDAVRLDLPLCQASGVSRRRKLGRFGARWEGRTWDWGQRDHPNLLLTINSWDTFCALCPQVSQSLYFTPRLAPSPLSGKEGAVCCYHNCRTGPRHQNILPNSLHGRKQRHASEWKPFSRYSLCHSFLNDRTVLFLNLNCTLSFANYLDMRGETCASKSNTYGWSFYSSLKISDDRAISVKRNFNFQDLAYIVGINIFSSSMNWKVKRWVIPLFPGFL